MMNTNSFYLSLDELRVAASGHFIIKLGFY